MLDVVSHTPVETESLTEVFQVGDWHDVVRAQWPEPQKVYSWWSYRSPDWDKADKGRRLDHVWVGRGLPRAKHKSRSCAMPGAGNAPRTMSL